MKKIPFFLLFLISTLNAQLVFHDWTGATTVMNTLTNWDPNIITGFAVTDSLVWSGTSTANSTANAPVSVGFVHASSAHTAGNLSWSGQSLTVVSGMNLNHAGTSNMGTALGITGNGDLLFNSGIGTVTATSCVVTMSGVADTWTDNKAISIAKMICNGANAVSNGLGETTISAGGIKITIAANCTLTISGADLKPYPGGSTTVISEGAGALINLTTRSLRIVISGGDLTDTIPAIKAIGTTGYISYGMVTNDNNTFVFVGTQDYGSAGCRPVFTTSGVFNLNGQNLTCGPFALGGIMAGKTYIFRMNGSILHINNYNDTTYNVGTSIDSLPDTTYCSGNISIGTSHSLVPRTSTFVIDSTGYISMRGQPFYNLIIAGTNGQDTITEKGTTTDSIVCYNDFTISSAMFNQNRRQLTIHGSYINNSPDSSNMNFQKDVYKDFTWGASSNAKNDSAVTKLKGTDTCHLTTNGKRLSKIHVTGLDDTKVCKLMDNDTIARFRDSVGKIFQNGKNMFDSILDISGANCRFNAPRKICQLFNMIYQPDTLTNWTTFIGDEPCTLSVNGLNAGNIRINQCDLCQQGLLQIGVAHYDSLEIDSGMFMQSTVTDTVYCNALTINSPDSTKILSKLAITGNALFNGGYFIPSDKVMTGGDVDITAGYWK